LGTSGTSTSGTSGTSGTSTSTGYVVSVSYTSTLKPNMRNLAKIRELVEFSEVRNKERNNSGKIFFDKRLERCWQYLEGEESAVWELWERIKMDENHTIDESKERELPARTIKNWGMGWKNVPPKNVTKEEERDGESKYNDHIDDGDDDGEQDGSDEHFERYAAEMSPRN